MTEEIESPIYTVIYARFSSHAQNEQSIEGQLKICYDFAKRNNFKVIGEYIDRALTGKTDKRPEFLRMIEDSKKRIFKYVIVYQLDRFARNRYDSAIYKAKLKKDGVRVLSALENISDDASGILMETVLEGMAEYFSAELKQKVERGMSISASKCLHLGGVPALGYKVNPDLTYSIDEQNAEAVRQIFEMYAGRKTVSEITQYLNSQHISTARGGTFNKNSLHRLMKNKRYIGIYTYKDTEIPDGMPRIISDELFWEVQEIMEKNKKAHAHARANEEYLLTTKLFCGYCRDMMTGVSGTSETGQIYNYYVCVKRKQKLCKKKNVRKDWIEDLVISKCRSLLTDENIELIAEACVEQNKKDGCDANLQRLQKLLKANETATENLFRALEAGQVAEQITARIKEKTIEREDLQTQIASEKMKHTRIEKEEIVFFLKELQKKSGNDLRSRRAIITVFVNAIYLFDDKITFIFNATNRQITITEPLLDEILESSKSSSVDESGVPVKRKAIACRFFIIPDKIKRSKYLPRFFCAQLSPSDFIFSNS